MNNLVPEESYEEREQKKVQAIKKRLSKLPANNPIVKMAKEEKENLKEKRDRQDKWEIVDKLTSVAYSMYMDEEIEFVEAVKSLAKAFSALS